MNAAIFTVTTMARAAQIVSEETFALTLAYNQAPTAAEREEAFRRMGDWMELGHRIEDMREQAEFYSEFPGQQHAYEMECLEEIREMATSLYEVDVATHTVSWTLKDGEQVRITVTPEGYHVMMQRPGEAKPWTPPSVCQFGPFPKGVNADTHIRFAAFLRAEITGAFLPVRHVHHAALEAMRASL